MNKFDFRQTNLDWIVDYDYERSQCTCHDYICRCTTIEYAHVTNIDVREVVDKLYSTHYKNDSDINKYCFDRICHTLEVYDKDLYEVKTGAGYYGEEVYGVYFENEEKVLNHYNMILSFDTDLEKIKYCLKREYGYLLDSVKNASSVYIADVSIDEIMLPQMEYLKKVNRKVIEAYTDINLPIAVCIKDDDKFRLIDGYHRFAANSDRKRVSIVVLE